MQELSVLLVLFAPDGRCGSILFHHSSESTNFFCLVLQCTCYLLSMQYIAAACRE